MRTSLQDPCLEQAGLKPFILGALDTPDMIQGLFYYLRFYWGGVESQHCVSFRHTAQQSDSALHIHMFILFQTLLPYRPSQSTEWSPLSDRVGLLSQDLEELFLSYISHWLPWWLRG